MRKPWFRKQTGEWYVTINGEQVRLGKEKKAAHDLWHQLISQQNREDTGDLYVAEVFDLYMQRSKQLVLDGDMKLKTLEDYVYFLDSFAELYGEMSVADLKPQHLSDWLLSKDTWGSSFRRRAIVVLKLVFNWAIKDSRISKHPFPNYDAPSQTRRNRLISDDEHRKLVLKVRDASKYTAKVDKQFQLVIVALKHTGGRPQDISRASVETVSEDVRRWVLPDHKRVKHTGKPKVVYLSPCLQTVTRILAHNRSEGPLFRGRKGGLSVSAISQRMREITHSLGIKDNLVAYSYRHTYVTKAIVAGVDVATVAELVGTSIQMIQRHYGHLSQEHDHMQAAAAQVLKRPK